jgi:F-type H+-transporting ATPase subunit alpha
VELFKQTQYQPLPVERQVAVIWAMQNGYFDTVPVERVKEYQNKLTEFLATRKEAVLAAIRDKKQIDKDVEALLKGAVDEFKSTWQ